VSPDPALNRGALSATLCSRPNHLVLRE
jgi:hypothetical protein